MVTLLIQDIRSGVVDHQLTEIKIPLRPTADPTDGFWADAKLLVRPCLFFYADNQISLLC